MSSPARRDERGITLTELTVVMVLAAVVTVGLVTFYLNSQTLWVDGSTQALAQRDATALAELIAARARTCSSADKFDSPDPLHQGLILRDPWGGETRFRWNSGDSLIHEDTLDVATGTLVDKGPPVQSKVLRFVVDRDFSLVYVRMLEVRSTSGTPVQLSTTAALYNR